MWVSHAAIAKLRYVASIADLAPQVIAVLQTVDEPLPNSRRIVALIPVGM